MAVKRARLLAGAYDASGSGGSDDAKQKAGKEIRKILKELLLTDVLKAKHLCLVSYWATLAGMCGVEDLAMFPDRKNESNFSAHVKLVLGREMKDPNLEYVSMPTVSKKGGVREFQEIPFMPITECIPDDVGVRVCYARLGKEIRKLVSGCVCGCSLHRRCTDIFCLGEEVRSKSVL
jgi:hypothetical protein